MSTLTPPTAPAVDTPVPRVIITKKSVVRALTKLVDQLRNLKRMCPPEGKGGLLLAEFQVAKLKLLPDFLDSLDATLKANFGEDGIKVAIVPYPSGSVECYFDTTDAAMEGALKVLRSIGCVEETGK